MGCSPFGVHLLSHGSRPAGLTLVFPLLFCMLLFPSSLPVWWFLPFLPPAFPEVPAHGFGVGSCPALGPLEPAQPCSTPLLTPCRLHPVQPYIQLKSGLCNHNSAPVCQVTRGNPSGNFISSTSRLPTLQSAPGCFESLFQLVDVYTDMHIHVFLFECVYIDR